MNLRDWRDEPAGVLARIYTLERARALGALQWDTAPAWREVERARTTWGLPGLLAVDDDGTVHGMAFYVVEDDWMDVGGLTSDDVQATDALLDGILAAAQAANVSTVRTLVHEGPEALHSGLRTRGFQVESHYYLSRRCAPAPRPIAARALGSWTDGDVEPAARLFERAYGQKAGALFAPHGRPAEWTRYVQNVVTHPGCGTLNPAVTAVLRDGGDLRGVALVTDIGPRTAHLVQLAVEPHLRRGGLGRALVEEVCDRLCGRQYDAMTLLVAAGNAPARALYHDEGFRHDATFLAAILHRTPAGATRGDALAAPDATRHP
jgi:ribosomal protein S18 acetylase RimI-like enzyme